MIFCRLNGNIYLLDSGNNRIQKWSTGGTIWTIAGEWPGNKSESIKQSTGSFL
jgi:hypothetical protein